MLEGWRSRLDGEVAEKGSREELNKEDTLAGLSGMDTQSSG